MSLIIKCPVTGAAFRLPMFAGTHGDNDSTSVHIISAPHPVLTASLEHLVALPFPLTAADRHIVLCAWLEKLAQVNAVHWLGALNAAHFSERWFLQQFEKFSTIAAWLATNPKHQAHNFIPQLRITAELTSENLQHWVEGVQDVISSYAGWVQDASKARLRRAQEAAAALTYAELDTAYETESPNSRRAKARRSYVHASLMFHEQQSQVDLILKVLGKPFNYELVLLQQVKSFCLDYLPENGHENYNDKQEVIALLDAAILDRVGMAQLLGYSNAADDTQAAEIQAKYTTSVDGQEFIVTNNPKINAAINRTTQAALNTSSAPIISSEPNRLDFTHQFLFDAAMRLWKAQR